MEISKKKFFVILAVAILSTTAITYATMYLKYHTTIENIVVGKGSVFDINLYEEDNSTLISPHDWGELWKGEYKEWKIWLESNSTVNTRLGWTQKAYPNTVDDTLPEGWRLSIVRTDNPTDGLNEYYSGVSETWELLPDEKLPFTIRLWNYNAESDVETTFAITWLVFEA